MRGRICRRKQCHRILLGDVGINEGDKAYVQKRAEI